MQRNFTKSESGQAFAEMVICLLPIMCIFLGILIVGALGLENLKATINARLAADCCSTNGIFSFELLDNKRSPVFSKKPEAIRTWDYGADRIPFTADDTPVTNSGSVVQDFSMRNAFQTDEYSFASGSKSSYRLLSLNAADLMEAQMVSPEIFGRANADSDSANLNRTFLDSANLVGAEVKMRNTMSRYGLTTSTSLFSSLLNDSTVITGEAFMPNRVITAGAEEEETTQPESTP